MIPLNSTGVILPKEALAKLNVTKGDTLMLTETPEGFVPTPYDVTFERQMNVAELAAGELTETDLSAWLESSSQR